MAVFIFSIIYSQLAFQDESAGSDAMSTTSIDYESIYIRDCASLDGREVFAPSTSQTTAKELQPAFNLRASILELS